MKYEIHGSIHPIPEKPPEPEKKDTSGVGATIGAFLGLALGAAALGPVGAALGFVGGAAVGDSVEKA
jgi:outer membrane lipoprotein SlyB